MKKNIKLMVIAAVALFAAAANTCAGENQLRVLYWNIQNGMWADQQNDYFNFVRFVRSENPDVCIWCEAKSLYEDGTKEPLDKNRQYLPDGWPELAKRYGHKYTYIAAYRDNYPQVITSKYPIADVQRIYGEEPDSVVVHGAGWVRINVRDRDINFVCIHTYPQKYSPKYKNASDADKAMSSERHDGDAYRATEVRYVCEHTIGTSPSASEEEWIFCGDFNSKSRVDNHFYKLEENDPAFQCQDYILDNTPYIDVIGTMYPGVFCTSNRGGGRPDYFYCTKPLFDRIVEAYIVNTDWTRPVRASAPASAFYIPSDHRPVFVVFDLSK